MHKLIIIDNAINNWKQRYNGVIFWFDVKTYSKEWCLEQIEFFENLKKITIKNKYYENSNTRTI